MRTFIVFAVLLVAAFANPMAEVKSLVQNDKCATESMSLIQPQIEEQIQKLKQVHHSNNFRTPTTLKPKPNFWPSLKKPRLFSNHATSVKKSNQSSVMPLKPPESDSCWPPTASKILVPSF